MIKKKPKFGAIPKLHMPQKSHEGTKPLSRPARTVMKDLDTEEQPAACYRDFPEFCWRMKVLKSLDEWEIKNLSDRVVLKKNEVPFLLPKIVIIVDDSLGPVSYTHLTLPTKLEV